MAKKQEESAQKEFKGISGKDMKILKLVLSKESDIIPMLKVQIPNISTQIQSPKVVPSNDVTMELLHNQKAVGEPTPSFMDVNKDLKLDAPSMME
jgi:hypothetical protein